MTVPVKVLRFDHVQNPQSMRLEVSSPGYLLPIDGVPGERLLMTLYSGLVQTNLEFAGDGISPVLIQFLLPAVVVDPAQVYGPKHVLFPIRPDDFRGAMIVATASDAVGKDIPVVASVVDATAALTTVSFSEAGDLDVVVANVTVHGQNCELNAVAYNATVLTRLSDIPPPALIPGKGWDGGFTLRANTVPGMPQRVKN